MKVVVCDDEPLARERVARMLEGMSGYEVVAQAGNGSECLSALEKQAADVVLLDIRMPEMDGLETAKHISEMESPPAVIFCTAYGEHALDAFKVNAVDYLLKPIRKDNLEKALSQATVLNKAQIQHLQENVPDESQGRTHISAKTHKGLELIPIEQIAYFMADQKYVTVYWEQGEVLIDETLKDLETEFNGRFLRIHRNALVAKNRIEALEQASQGHYVVRLQGVEERVTVSRRHVSGLRKVMQSL